MNHTSSSASALLGWINAFKMTLVIISLPLRQSLHGYFPHVPRTDWRSALRCAVGGRPVYLPVDWGNRSSEKNSPFIADFYTNEVILATRGVALWWPVEVIVWGTPTLASLTRRLHCGVRNVCKAFGPLAPLVNLEAQLLIIIIQFQWWFRKWTFVSYIAFIQLWAAEASV